MAGQSTILCSRPPDLYINSKLIFFVPLPDRCFFFPSSSCTTIASAVSRIESKGREGVKEEGREGERGREGGGKESVEGGRGVGEGK